MKRVLFGSLAFAAGVLMLASTATSQPPGGGGGGGGKGGPPKFEIGVIFPAQLKKDLKLTADQEKSLDAMEKDLKEKLDKLLTDDQKKTIENFRPGRGGQGGPGGPGGGGGGGKGGPPGGGPPGGGEKPPQ